MQVEIKTLPIDANQLRSSIPVIGRVPTVLIAAEAYVRMVLYTELCPHEIGWFGTAFETGTGDVLIEEVFLPRQEVSPATVYTDAIADLGELFLSQGEEGVRRWTALRFWGHSHAFHDTNLSTIDLAQMSQFGATSGHPWFLCGVFNKRQQVDFWLADYRLGLMIPLPWRIYVDGEEQLAEQIEGEIRSKVRPLQTGRTARRLRHGPAFT